MTDFAFATCALGVEPALKREVARTRADLRFAYSRPGLVTFKSTTAVAPDDKPGSGFARVWGKSLGAAADVAGATQLLVNLGAHRVHVFARDPEMPVDHTAWQFGLPGGLALRNELIADVIVDTGGAWVGIHRHDDADLPHAGGAIPVDVPPESPSRAYAKIEEAIAWAQLPIARGQVALEIGAAPGGAAMALARRGLEVWALDPGELAPAVLALGVHHLPIKVGALRWEELPPHVDWLLVDVNLAPQVALHEIARVMPPLLRAGLRGAVITLKLNDWSFVDALPALVARIEAMGLPRVRLRHLPSNRKEICAVATRL